MYGMYDVFRKLFSSQCPMVMNLSRDLEWRIERNRHGEEKSSPFAFVLSLLLLEFVRQGGYAAMMVASSSVAVGASS